MPNGMLIDEVPSFFDTLALGNGELSMIDRFIRIMVVVVLGTISAPSFADTYIQGQYSGMELSGEEDISGMEVLVVGATDGYYALVQCSKGEPFPPTLSKIVVKGASATFSLSPVSKTGCEGSKAIGKFTKDALELTFSGQSKPIKLMKGESYWSKLSRE